MEKIFAIILKVLKSKWFWIGLAILIVLIILHKNFDIISDKVKVWFKQTHGDFGECSLTANDKTTIESIAKQLREKIYGNFIAEDRETILDTCNSLNDCQFKYLINYYNKYLGNAYEDVDWEVMPFTSADETFLSRIVGMGLK